MKNLIGNCGLTLVEIIIAIALSSIILLSVTRLFSTSLTSYNLQDQLSDMNQNAKFTIKELSNILMQAGADMQLVDSDTLDKDTVIIPDSNKAVCSGFTIKINPRGGLYEIPESRAPTCSIQVDDARLFRYADKMARIPSVLSPSAHVKIYSLLRCDTVTNYVVFSPSDSFSQNDAICSFIYNHYYVKNRNLCLNNDTTIIAENIDSLSIAFFNRSGTGTSSWKNMRSVKMYVRARTIRPDMGYNGYPDHYYRIVLTNEFRLRNKINNNL
jgi:prepilin-type N-terminal cleavage/methylation domain-containing protein